MKSESRTPTRSRLFVKPFLISLSLLLILATNPPMANAQDQVVVFAASSLAESHTKLGKLFESSNPDFKIRFVFSASTTLATQISEGAKADIYISASPEDMKRVSTGRNYLKNSVVLAVPINSRIRKTSQLNHGIIWIRCANQIPCGRAAQRAIAAEGITSTPKSLEPMAVSVISKLLAGEVDAAVVYQSDVVANRTKIREIQFRDKASAMTQYKIAELSKTLLSKKVYKFLLSSQSKKLLQSYGFELS